MERKGKHILVVFLTYSDPDVNSSLISVNIAESFVCIEVMLSDFLQRVTLADSIKVFSVLVFLLALSQCQSTEGYKK